MWQSAHGTFLGQGKYVVEILKRFEILDCKEIATPMASKLNILSDASSDSVNAMMYHQMMWLIDVPDEYKTRHMLCGEHPKPVPDRYDTCSPDSYKECAEVPKRYSVLWAQI